MAAFKYWISGGLIRDPRSAIYFLGMLTAVALFLMFYLWQITAAYAAIQNNLATETTYFSLRGRVLRSGASAAGAWKTYLNDDKGFEFKYPAAWTFDDRVANNIVVTPGRPRGLSESDQLKIGDTWPSFRVTIYPNSKGLSAAAYYDRITAPRLRDDIEHGAVEVSLGGRSAMQFTELGVTERWFYLIGSDTQMFEFSFDVDPPSAFGELEDTFDAMVRSVVIK
ncbi:MAG: hypothetical protein RL681_816 [Candidatus Parcubacteria bacterium]